MKEILKKLIPDVILFYVCYAVLFLGINWLIENLPGRWDRTGIGMLAIILFFFGFVLGAFKIGASYSDKLSEQQAGTVFGVLKRPVRSVKYGLISIFLHFLLLYLTVICL